MEKYTEAKAKLFTSLTDKSKIAIINCDDPIAGEIVKECKASLLYYGIENKGDVRAKNLVLSTNGSTFQVSYNNHLFSVETSLIGKLNIYNSLAAISVALAQGVSISTIQRKMKTFPGVPGRLEKVENKQGIHFFVDFAHTDHALTSVLSALENIKKRRIITIFGCGGNRDQEKRPKMAKAVEKFSDYIIITSDNPRDEDPYTICKQIKGGLTKKKPFFIEVDRKKAIEKGIEVAEKDDIILLAGRGHEPFQKIRGRFVPFDDCLVVKEVFLEKLK